MSMEAMNAFLEKAQADEAVGKKLVAIIEENEGEAIYSRVVSLANDNGFTVTEADAKETQAQYVQAIDSAEAAEGDLNDEDLEKVAGGTSQAGLYNYYHGPGGTKTAIPKLFFGRW